MSHAISQETWGIDPWLTQCWTSVSSAGLMLDHRLRRWANIKPTLNTMGNDDF